jgi:hypothetical protein
MVIVPKSATDTASIGVTESSSVDTGRQEEKIDGLEALVAELRTDRDAWRSKADEAENRLADETEQLRILLAQSQSPMLGEGASRSEDEPAGFQSLSGSFRSGNLWL